jgi:hypothetical protein
MINGMEKETEYRFDEKVELQEKKRKKKEKNEKEFRATDEQKGKLNSEKSKRFTTKVYYQNYEILCEYRQMG